MASVKMQGTLRECNWFLHIFNWWFIKCDVAEAAQPEVQSEYGRSKLLIERLLGLPLGKVRAQGQDSWHWSSLSLFIICIIAISRGWIPMLIVLGVCQAHHLSVVSVRLGTSDDSGSQNWGCSQAPQSQQSKMGYTGTWALPRRAPTQGAPRFRREEAQVKPTLSNLSGSWYLSG